MGYLRLAIVLIATAMALRTDLKDRMIYKCHTMPVFILGLTYTLYNLSPYFAHVSLSKEGMIILWYIIRAWLGPILFIFFYSIFMFWLGILDGGDGQFLIAITPWLGAREMIEVILYFYPVAILYLAFYLLQQNKFDYKKVAWQQGHDFVTLIKSLPKVFANMKNGEEHVLVKNIPYKSKTTIPPAGMVPISMAIIISLLK